MANGDGGCNENNEFPSIPPETMSALKFYLPTDEGKFFAVPTSWHYLSGFLQDYTLSEENIPFEGYFLVDFERLNLILNDVRFRHPEAYLKGLNGAHFTDIQFASTTAFLSDMDNQERIRLANLTDFLSVPVARRAVLNFFADTIATIPSSDVDRLTSMIGCTPLEKDDIKSFGLEEERCLWEAFPNIFEKIYGHPYEPNRPADE